MSDSYQVALSATDTLAGHPFHLFSISPTPVTLSGLADTVASDFVGTGKEFAGVAKFVQGTSGPELNVTITDDIPDVPSSLIDNIPFANLNVIEGELVSAAENLGIEFGITGTITKAAA